MRAITIHAYGGPDVLGFEEAPKPEPGDGEVRVRIYAAGVNPVDGKLRAGAMKAMLELPFPWIPGLDFSGVTDDGAAVFGKSDLPRNGSYAEYVVVPRISIAPKPRSLDHIHAAAVPLAGLTAWQALFGAGGLDPLPGQTLLVLGAGGGVGSFAIQLARWKGARVIGTARPGQANHVRGLGAEPIRDLSDVGPVDAVLDLVGGELPSRALSLIARGGAIASVMGPPSADEAKARDVRSLFVSTQTNAAQLTELATLIDAGTVKVVVDETLPLEAARKAHERLERGGVSGKLVLAVD